MLADADPTAIDAFLLRAFWNVSADKRAGFKTWLSRQAVKIVQNWPRTQEELPCHIIVLGAGDNREFVGLVGDALELSADSPAGPVSGEQWNVSIGILTRAQNPEQITVLHQLAKFFIARKRQELVDTFEFNVAMSERDLQPREPHSANFVYERLLQVSVSFLQLNAVDIESTDIVGFTTRPAGDYATHG
ncbi:MAG: hypothetical protein ABI629_10430 [bacterium]